MKIRCSQLGSIMTMPKSKSEVLSVGAKTYIESLAKQHVYGYTPEVSTKEMAKGTIVEPHSIELINEVFFQNYKKNTQHFENEWLTGTPDIIDGPHVIDVKSSWSLSTFPALPEDGENKMYEWQLRGYMQLTGCTHASLVYCMVDTPDELINYECEAVHRVSHIEPNLRITTLEFIFDAKLNVYIIQQVQHAQQYFLEVVERINTIHA